MLSLFHSIKAGVFSPENQNIALDYRSLFLDPLKANMVMMHEQVHNVLSNTTDYGLATITLFEIRNIAKKEFRNDFDDLLAFVIKSQLTVQESTATFIEMQHLKKKMGKAFTYQYAKNNLPQDYYDRFIALKTIFDASKKYRDNFTTKIPLIALHNGIRSRYLETSIKTIEDLRDFILNDEDLPDERFRKLMNAVIKKPSILNKTQEEICDIVGIKFYPDTSKEDVMNFLNSLLNFTNESVRYTIDDIHGGRELNEIILTSSDRLLITNLNTNIAATAETLFKLEDFLHYTDIFKAIIISGANDDIDGKELLENFWKRKFEASILAFTNQISKYIYPSTFREISELLDKEFRDIPLIVKWGLYKPNSQITLFNTKRTPDAVIYNYPSDLINNFKEIEGIKLKYMHISASLEHPFQIIIIKDSNEVVHIVNTMSKGAYQIKEQLKDILEEGDTSDFINQKEYINLTWNIWNGLDSDYDWFANLSTQPK